MCRLLSTFLRDEDGATAIEYSLLIAMIAMGVVYGATQIGAQTLMPFNFIANFYNSSP